MPDQPAEMPAPAALNAATGSCARRIAAIMGEITSRVEKRGRNEFHRYDYATEADLLDLLRAKMAAHGLALLPTVVQSSRTPVGDKGEFLTELWVDFTFHADDGDSLAFRVVGTGTDKLDKGAYKALTGAEKYALMKAFMVSTGDDPEREDAPPARQERRSQVQPSGQRAEAQKPGPHPVQPAQPAQKPGPTAPRPVDATKHVDEEQAKEIYRLGKAACGGDVDTFRKLLQRLTAVGTFPGVDHPRNVPAEQYQWLRATLLQERG